MSTPRAAYLALAAVIFGGAVLGAGNALQGYLQAANTQTTNNSALHAHHHHGATQDQDTDPADTDLTATDLNTTGLNNREKDNSALANFLNMPAHCMFCIDGTAPQPVALANSKTSLSTPGNNFVTHTATRCSPAQPSFGFHSRAPPALS